MYMFIDLPVVSPIQCVMDNHYSFPSQLLNVFLRKPVLVTSRNEAPPGILQSGYNDNSCVHKTKHSTAYASLSIPSNALVMSSSNR